MKCAVSASVLLFVVAVATAMPTLQEIDGGHRGWETWAALRNWMQPVTNYITQSLPDKTPTEFATDVRDAAADFRDRAQDHPVVQGVSRVVWPVHQWIRDSASALSRTSFRDMFDSASGYAQAADNRVAQWLNDNRNAQIQYGPRPLGDNIEQILE